MKLLNDRYGITEKDFTRAEIEMVPAYKAVDIGLDRGSSVPMDRMTVCARIQR